LEIGVEFFAATADRIGMEAGDLGQEFVAAVSDLDGLQSRQPAALLFIEAAEDEVDAMMTLAVGMVLAGRASRALTLMHNKVGHDTISLLAFLGQMSV
jgi:hypothetical protein